MGRCMSGRESVIEPQTHQKQVAPGNCESAVHTQASIVQSLDIWWAFSDKSQLVVAEEARSKSNIAMYGLTLYQALASL